METSPPRSVEDALQEKNTGNITTGEDQEPSSPTHSEKLQQDGSTELNPQPTSDPNDPLNWSVFKKHLFLFIIAITAFLPDYGSSTGAITNLVQPEYLPSCPSFLIQTLTIYRTWNLPETVVNEALVGNLFMYVHLGAHLFVFC